jgi:hypothetical protein
MQSVSSVARLPHAAVGERTTTHLAQIQRLALVVLTLTTIPYLCGYLLAPRGMTFLGALNNVGDLSQYLAAIRQGSSGAWRYTNQFTPDHATPLLIYTPYLLAGHLSFGLSPTIVFQILRLTCAGLALAALADFCRLFVGPFALRATWLFALLAGGLYWLALPLSGFLPWLVNPPDLTAPELNPLITILISPHESLGLAAELFGWSCLLRAEGAVTNLWFSERPRLIDHSQTRQQLALAAASFLVLALSYPFLLPTVGCILLGHAVVSARTVRHSRPLGARRKSQMRTGEVFMLQLRRLCLVLFPAGLVGLYYLRVFHDDPLWSHSGMTQIAGPDPAMLLFAFGPLAVVAYTGVVKLRAWRITGENAMPAAWFWFPAVWAVANMATLLLPLPQQGRQALGLSVPLALLSVLALAGPQKIQGTRVILPALPTSVLVFSSPLLLALYTAVTAGGINHEYYTPSSVSAAVQWLGDHATAQDVVLSSAGFGNLVPEDCTCRVVVGQNFQSFDWTRRQAEIHAFYAAPTTMAAQAVLVGIEQREGVSYIVYSPLERGIGQMQLRAIRGFSKQYSRDGVIIFGRTTSR